MSQTTTIEDVQSVQWDNSTEDRQVSKDVESLFGSLPKSKDPSLDDLRAKMKNKLNQKKVQSQIESQGNQLMPNAALNMLQQSMEEMSLAEAQGKDLPESKQKEIFSKTQGVLSSLMKSLPAKQRKMFEGVQKMMEMEDKPTEKEMPLRPRVVRTPKPMITRKGSPERLTDVSVSTPSLITPSSTSSITPTTTTPTTSTPLLTTTPSTTTTTTTQTQTTLNKSQKRNKRRRIKNKILLSTLKQTKQ